MHEGEITRANEKFVTPAAHAITQSFFSRRVRIRGRRR